MNAGRWKRVRRSSSERVGSGTTPNIPMSTAPPAMSSVPAITHGEEPSPSRIRAKNAFQSNETAPSGARITTGRDAIWKREPMIFEEMKMASED